MRVAVFPFTTEELIDEQPAKDEAVKLIVFDDEVTLVPPEAM